MSDRDVNPFAKIPIGAEFRTPANLEDLAEHIKERINPEDALLGSVPNRRAVIRCSW